MLFWIGTQFQQLCFQKYLFEQLIHIRSLFCRDFLALMFSSPVFYQYVHVGKLFPDFFRIGPLFVNFVDRKDHGNSRCRCVVNGFHSLRHDGIVCRYNDDGHIGDFRPACPHGSKGFVSRCVKERYQTFVFKPYTVGPDMLRYAACFSGDDIGIADIVKQRCFAMVHVSHHGNNGRPFTEIHGIILLFLDGVMNLCSHEFNLESEFFGNKDHRFGIQALVDGNHKPQIHTGINDLDHRHVHQSRQFVDTHEFSNFENGAFHFLALHFLDHALIDNVTFFTAVLGPFCLSLPLGHPGVCFLNLFLNGILVHFYVNGFEAFFAATAYLVPVFCLFGSHFGHINTFPVRFLDAFPFSFLLVCSGFFFILGRLFPVKL